MAQSPQTAWPKTIDDVTDWDVVFEAPETGFIALIVQVQSSAALKLGATVVIEKLFTRKADSDERMRLIEQLDAIIVDDVDIAAMIEDVTRLLRSIKENRIEKARVYVQRRQAGAAIDRRSGLLWKIDFLLRPIVFLPMGGLIIAALSGLMFLFLQSTFGPTTQDTAPPREEQPVSPKMDLADTQPSSVTPPSAKTTVSAAPLIPIVLKAFRWPLMTQNATQRAQYYAVVLYVEKRRSSRPICIRVPQVLDTIYQSFNAMVPPNGTAQEDKLKRLQDSVKRRVNAILPAPIVLAVDVARYGEKSYRVTTVRPFCRVVNPPVAPPRQNETSRQNEK